MKNGKKILGGQHFEMKMVRNFSWAIFREMMTKKIFLSDFPREKWEKNSFVGNFSRDNDEKNFSGNFPRGKRGKKFLWAVFREIMPKIIFLDNFLRGKRENNFFVDNVPRENVKFFFWTIFREDRYTHKIFNNFRKSVKMTIYAVLYLFYAVISFYTKNWCDSQRHLTSDRPNISSKYAPNIPYHRTYFEQKNKSKLELFNRSWNNLMIKVSKIWKKKNSAKIRKNGFLLRNFKIIQ